MAGAATAIPDGLGLKCSKASKNKLGSRRKYAGIGIKQLNWVTFSNSASRAFLCSVFVASGFTMLINFAQYLCQSNSDYRSVVAKTETPFQSRFGFALHDP